MLDRTFKFVYVTYKDGSPKPSEAFTLVTDIQYNNYDGFGSIDKIVIIPECDIKKFIIKRTDHEDLVINVNGGTYRND